TGGGEGRKEIRSGARDRGLHQVEASDAAPYFRAALSDANLGRGRQVPSGALKRFLLMLSDRIFDSRVDRAIPSLAAAPVGPKIRPWDSRRASSIISLSVAATFSGSKSLFPDLVSTGRWDSQ